MGFGIDWAQEAVNQVTVSKLRKYRSGGTGRHKGLDSLMVDELE